MLSLHAVFFVALLSHMKMIILLISLLQFSTPSYILKNGHRYSSKEKKFIKNVIRMHGKEQPISITKNKARTITIEFSQEKFTLTPNGWMGESWIKETGSEEWLSLGCELD